MDTEDLLKAARANGGDQIQNADNIEMSIFDQTNVSNANIETEVNLE